jgi:tryptophan-rich sensory protein
VQVLAAALNALATRLRGGRPARPGYRGDTRWSDTLKRPIFQPPNWLFPIAWPINNVGQIYGGLRVLDRPHGTPGRTAYLALQGATWVDYVLFNAGYFGLRSTINSFALTAVYLALTVASLFVAVFRLRDWRVALSLATTLLWLCVALPSALAQLLWNRDSFYGVGPFAKPDRAWLRK